MKAASSFRLGTAAREPENLVQILKFGLVGGSGYLINIAAFAILTEDLGLQHTLAAVVAFCVAVVNNYSWNRRWTFGPGKGSIGTEAARFLLVSLGSLLLSIGMLELLIHSDVAQLPAQALAVAFAMPFNFLGNRLWTFR